MPVKSSFFLNNCVRASSPRGSSKRVHEWCQKGYAKGVSVGWQRRGMFGGDKEGGNVSQDRTRDRTQYQNEASGEGSLT